MSFSKGLKKIFESIKRLDESKQAGMLDNAISRIAKDPFLSYQYELQEAINNNTNLLSEEEADKFVAQLKEKHEAFIKKYKPTITSFRNAEKKLFEFFNINYKELEPEKKDLAINPKNFALMESIIKSIVYNENILSGKKLLDSKKDVIKESFVAINKLNDLRGLEDRLNIIAEKAKRFKNHTEFINNSISTIMEDISKDFSQAANKAYKLSLIMEKLRMNEGKIVKIDSSSIQLVNSLEVEMPDNTDEAVSIMFKVPIYPTSANLSTNLVNMPKVKNYLQGLSRTFSNCIYKTGSRDVFEMTGVKLLVDLPTSEPKAGTFDSNGKYTPKSYNASFEAIVFLQPGVEIDQKLISEKSYRVVKAFADVLNQIKEIKDYLNAEAQIEDAKSKGTSRKTKYDKTNGVNKYYKDKSEDESWMNQILGGTEESDIENTKDKQFYGDANRGNEIGSSEERMDKIASRRASRNAA